jgi:hypothetical protein
MPTNLQAPPEQLVMAKELVDFFAAQGIGISYRYARAIIQQCPQSIRGRYILPSNAWTWWVLHPGFQPFGEKARKSDTTGDLCT